MALPSMWSSFLAAIRAQESGGNYTQNSPGCLGAYCWNAQSNWDMMARAAGQVRYIGVNPAQVPSEVQDEVASTNLYKIYQQTHSLAAAARWWNGGTTTSEANPGLPAQKWAPHCGGGSSAAYACQVLQRMSLGGHFLAGAGSGSGGTVPTAPSSQADCFIGIPGIPGTSIINDIFGSGGNVGGFCLLTRSQARAVYAVALIGAGGILVLVGMGFIAGFSLARHATSIVTRVLPSTQGAKLTDAQLMARQERADKAQIPKRTDLRSSNATP
jgi:hypothetical protein